MVHDLKENAVTLLASFKQISNMFLLVDLHHCNKLVECVRRLLFQVIVAKLVSFEEIFIRHQSLFQTQSNNIFSPQTANDLNVDMSTSFEDGFIFVKYFYVLGRTFKNINFTQTIDI